MTQNSSQESATRFCAKCGTQARVEDKFCSKCREPFEELVKDREKSARIPAPTRKTLQGWLIVFGLGCFLGSCNPFATVIGGISAQDNNTVSNFHTFYYLYCLVATIGLWSIVILLLTPKRPSSALWIVVILLTLLAFTTLNWLLQESLLSKGAEALTDTTSWRIDALRGIAWLVLWLWYFFRSRYVRDNYGEVSLKRLGAVLHLK